MRAKTKTIPLLRDKTFAIYAVLGYIVLLFVLLVSIAPLIWVLLSSFKTNNEILSSAFSLPHSPSLVGYRIASDTANIPMRFLTSLTVASSTTVVSVFIYSMAAYVLARCEFKLRNAIFGLLICSLLIPSNAMIQPIYSTIKALGLYDTKFALILVYTGFAMAMCLFLMKSYFQSIPKELEEAATIEGAGFFTVFWKVILPISKPALASSAILTFINSWNELLYALLLTSKEVNRTLPLTMKYFTSMFSFNFTPMFAALVMCIAPTILIYVLLQEQIMESMVAGSVKG
ncbi:MAG: carbohydrate ABC transporter permease [Oscillospiraceae bacterium]|nr:carbohydrate ABC transporter permease [Oscillospiraceae bacterium]